MRPGRHSTMIRVLGALRLGFPLTVNQLADMLDLRPQRCAACLTELERSSAAIRAGIGRPSDIGGIAPALWTVAPHWRAPRPPLIARMMPSSRL